MSDLMKLIKSSIFDNNANDLTSLSPTIISEIFAPGENFYFTQKRATSNTLVSLSPTKIEGSQRLINSFQFDEKTLSKISYIQSLVSNHFEIHAVTREQILNTKSISALHVKTKSGTTQKMIYHDLATSITDEGKIDDSIIVFTNTSYLQIPEGRVYLMDITTNEVIDQIKHELDDAYYINENEYQILNSTILGYSNKEISEQLNLSENTVQKYRKNIIKKTKSKNLFEVIKKYHNNKVRPSF